MIGSRLSAARYNEFLRRVHALARRSDITLDVREVLRRSGYALPFVQLNVGAGRPVQLLVSGGFHGDEPAGVYAALACAERLAATGGPVGALVLPCANPMGFLAASRSNDIGYDLNRTFGQDPAPRETELVREAIRGRSFACALDLHEDSDADGFYVYEHARSPGAVLAPALVQRVRSANFPIHTGTSVEGYDLHDGCVVPKEETVSELVGFFSVYVYEFHTAQSLTTETPSHLPLAARVAMQLEAFDELVARLVARFTPPPAQR